MDNIDLFFTIINEFFNFDNSDETGDREEILTEEDEVFSPSNNSEEEIINSDWFKNLCKAAIEKEKEDDGHFLNQEKNIELILNQYAPKYFIEAFYKYKKEILDNKNEENIVKEKIDYIENNILNSYEKNTENKRINNDFVSLNTAIHDVQNLQNIQNIHNNNIEQNNNSYETINENNKGQMALNLPVKTENKAPLNINLTINGTFNLEKKADIDDFGKNLAEILNQANENRDNIPI